MSLGERLERLDHRQQGSRRIGFVAAVVKKFGDDQAGQLAALISYYGFVSLFPLMLVFVTILGFVLRRQPARARKDPQRGARAVPDHQRPAQIPLPQRQRPGARDRAGVRAAGGAGDHERLPERVQPDLERPLQAASQLVLDPASRPRACWRCWARSRSPPRSRPASSARAPTAPRPSSAGVLVALAFNLALFMLAFKLLTAIDLGWRELLPGVILASVFWQLLEHLGGFYIDHALKRTGPLYGVFALVLGLLALALPRRAADDLRGRGERRAQVPACGPAASSPSACSRPTSRRSPHPPWWRSASSPSRWT